jgi:hypothetical protein
MRQQMGIAINRERFEAPNMKWWVYGIKENLTHI